MLAKTKKILAMVLTLCMVVGMLGTAAIAAEEPESTGGPEVLSGTDPTPGENPDDTQPTDGQAALQAQVDAAEAGGTGTLEGDVELAGAVFIS